MLDIHTVFEYNIHMLNMLRNIRFKFILFSLLFLLIGLLIYLFFRSDTIIHSFLPSSNNLKLEKIHPIINKSFFIDVLRFYIVDFLWGAALSFSLCAIACKLDSLHIILYSILSFCLGVLYEIFQYFSIFPGTFDVADICMYAVAAIFCAAINIKIFLRRTL